MPHVPGDCRTSRRATRIARPSAYILSRLRRQLARADLSRRRKGGTLMILRHRPARRDREMAQEPLARKGNFLHIYDFIVEKGREDEFIRLFEEFDYSDGNPMHKSSAQVKDGVLCRDTENPQRFFLIAEWADIVEHARIRKILAEEIKPAFVGLIEGRKFVPKYVEVVSSTPEEILNAAQK
jgi:hypothetical protein